MMVEITPQDYVNHLEKLLADCVRMRLRPQLIDEMVKLWHEARRAANMETV